MRWFKRESSPQKIVIPLCGEAFSRSRFDQSCRIRETHCLSVFQQQSMTMILLKPSIDRLPSYVAALREGWSPDNLRPEAAQEQIDIISVDAEGFVSDLDGLPAKTGTVTLTDGSKVPQLPSYKRWIWADALCGHLTLRLQPGTEKLPATCSGHIGYAVAPWRQGEGLATAALVGILPEATAVGLRYADFTTRRENPASIRVIEEGGGRLVKSYMAHPSHGAHETLQFQILQN